MKMELDDLMEYGIEIFNKLFDLNLYWDYAIIDDSTSK